MIEVNLHNPGPCAEAILAFLGQGAFQPVVWEDEAGAKKISFYLEEARWAAVRETILEKLNEICLNFDVPVPEITVGFLKESDWRDAWKRYAKIYRFGHDLIIKPSWRKLRKPASCPVISIDPQMAFGTGGHASTRLCLRHLIRLKKESPAVLEGILDVGTGSGILAIAAARLGGQRIVALDIDPVAITIARKNAENNGVAEKIRFFRGPIQAVRGQYRLILANITLPTLSELLTAFAGRLAPAGVFVVSGLLREQADGFLERALEAGLKKRSRRTLGEWVSFALAPRGAGA